MGKRTGMLGQCGSHGQQCHEDHAAHEDCQERAASHGYSRLWQWKGPSSPTGWAFRLSGGSAISRYMNFINLSLASSITGAVIVTPPLSFGSRSISLRAIG